MAPTLDVRIRPGTVDDIDLLKPLWVAVHHHHQGAAPELGPYVDDTTTWLQRSALYRDCLARPDTFLELADMDSEIVGYLLVRMLDCADSWWDDTWVTTSRVAELESFSVRSDVRGRGIGSTLLTHMNEHLAAQGIDNVVVGALPQNSDAIRLYERAGFAPAWLYLTRFSARTARL